MSTNAARSPHFLGRSFTFAGEFFRTYTPLGLRLVDTQTGNSPLGFLRMLVDVSDGQGGWKEVEDPPVIITSSGNVAMPGFGRTSNASQRQLRLHRFRIEAQHYHPSYPAPTAHPILLPAPQLPSMKHFPFVVFPWDFETPPPVILAGTADLNLFPAPTYPFSTEVEILRGRVTDQNDQPLVRAQLVGPGPLSPRQAFTDPSGSFALPFRRFKRATPQPTVPFNLTITDATNNQANVFSVKHPDDFQTSRTFKLT